MPKMDILSHLPLELIETIISNVEDRDELFALRLSCKVLNQVATALAFCDLGVCLQEGSLRKLLKIAESPHLTQYVKYISCGMDEFYNMEYDTFSQCIHNPTEEDLREPIGCWQTEAEMEQEYEYYSLYTICCMQQNSLRKNNGDVKALARAFAMFPALESVEITDEHESRILLNSCETDYGLAVLKEPLLLPHMFGPIEARTSRGKRQLEVVIRALVLSNTELRNFSLNLSGKYPGGFDGPLFPFTDRFHEEIEIACGSLRALVLDLELGVLYISLIPIEGPQRLSVTSMLAAAKNLEDLSLIDLFDMNSDDDPDDDASFESMIGVPQFKNLQRLFISKLVVEENVLSNFLQNSCKGLRELQIFEARLLTGTWTSLFSSISHLPSLEVCDLENIRYEYEYGNRGSWTTLLRDGPQIDALSEYLCRRTDVDPWPGIIEKELRESEEEDREDEEEDRRIEESMRIASATAEGDTGL